MASTNAVANASGDALQNASQAEQVVGEIPVEVRNARTTRRLAVDLDRLFQRRDIEFGKRRIDKRADRVYNAARDHSRRANQ